MLPRSIRPNGVGKPLITVINDDRVFLDLMEELLEHVGYRVHTLRDTEGAYPVVRKQQPDLIVLDLRFADPDGGLRVLEAMRLDPVTTRIPVIVCSADDVLLEKSEKRLRQLRCYVLPKPFELEQLLGIIKQALKSQ